MQELLQTEWQDETDRFLDNKFEEQVAPTPKNSELPPGLLRYVAAEWQQIQRRESRQGPFLKSIASAPTVIVSRSNSGGGKVSGKISRKKSRMKQQKHHHLAGALPNLLRENGEGGRDNENAPYLDV